MITWLDEFIESGGKLTKDRRAAIVYHATTEDRARRIEDEGVLRSPPDAPDSYGVYVSSAPEVARDYGDGTVVKMEVLLRDMHPDDVFPGRRMDFYMVTRHGVYRPRRIVSVTTTW